MEKKWDVCVRAKNVEFRILKGGERASAYERDWKGAHVSFSISANKEQYVMTVEFLYGKRIDILLEKEMSRFQVQEDVGRVTIISNPRKSTFCVKNVQKILALRIKTFLQNLAQVQKKMTSPVNKPAHEDNADASLQKTLRLSPPENTRILPPSGRMCYSDSKQTTGGGRLFSLGKRQRTASSSVRFCVSSDDEKPEKTCRSRSNGHSKKFQDFRKAQSDVRHAKMLHLSSSFDDAKENTSPNILKKPSPGSDKMFTGLTKSFFYGSKSDDSFMAEIKNHLSKSPSPSKRSTKQPLNPNASYLSTSSAVRSLLLGDKPALDQSKKDDLGIKKLPDSTFEDTALEETWEKFPLSDKANVISSTNTQRGGFQNIGNTCYMNSTLQSLFGLITFQKDLKNLEETIKPHSPSDSVLSALTNLMQHKSASPFQKSALLKAVKQAISSNAKQFHGFAQQDAHEFVRLCLDLVQEEIVKINKKKESNTSDPKLMVTPVVSSESSQEKVPCPVAKNFAFTVKNEIVCSNCNGVTSREEQLYDLPVELRQERNSREAVCLQKLVNHTFSVENVEHECYKCKHKKASVHKIITKLPRVMLLYLKRYSYNSRYDQSEKLRQSVSIPRYLTFKQHCDKEVQYDASEKLKFFEHTKTIIPDSTQAEVVSDKELLEYCETLENFDELSSMHVSSPFSKSNLTDTNNNASEKSDGKLSRGSSGHFLRVEYPLRDTDIEKAVKASVEEYYENAKSYILPDQSKLQNMSEEDQIFLAMQLSMQENQQMDVTECGSANTTSSKQIDSYSSEKISPCSIDDVSGMSPLKTRSRRRNLTPGPFDSTDTESLNWSSEQQDKKLSASPNFSHCSPLSLPSPPPESHQQPDLAHSCPSLSSIQNLVGKFETNERNDGSSHLQSGSSGLDVFTQRPHAVLESALNAKEGMSSPTPELGDEVDKTEDDDEEDSNEMFKNQSTGHLPHSYHIVSIVSHKGGSSRYGHYVSDVLTDYSTNQWQCFDDDYVESFSEECVLLGRQSSCYLLFYVHK